MGCGGELGQYNDRCISNSPILFSNCSLNTSLAVASGAVLQHAGKLLTGSNATVTLTVGDADRVACLQLTGPLPTSIDWYDPQGQLVSTDSGDKVYQAGTGGGRVANLHFKSYQRSQGGKYECRVAVPGNNLEKLPICIGEWHPLVGGCKLYTLYL